MQFSTLDLQKLLLAGEVQAYNLKLISLFQADSWFVVLIERGRKQGGRDLWKNAIFSGPENIYALSYAHPLREGQ